MLHENGPGVPKWWILLFAGTLLVSIFYVPYFLKLSPPSHINNQNQGRALQEKKSLVSSTPSNVISGPLNQGKAIYLEKCAICHGLLGEGGIGPNLADSYWLHGNRPEDILKTIRDGVPNKGMVAWKTILPPKAIESVRDYIKTLEGTNPPHSKAPQGRVQ